MNRKHKTTETNSSWTVYNMDLENAKQKKDDAEKKLLKTSERVVENGKSLGIHEKLHIQYLMSYDNTNAYIISYQRARYAGSLMALQRDFEKYKRACEELNSITTDTERDAVYHTK